MAAFVLVHGAWHGGWCWRRVAPKLRSAGHEVFTPTLTGLGERAHLARPEVGLETHVRDVSAVLDFEDLRDAVVVGHSYAGMVIAGLPAGSADRIAHLVYLDAYLPAPAQSLADIVGPARLARWRRLARAGGADWLIPPPEDDIFDITDAADAAWVRGKLTPHPLKTFTDPACPAPPGRPELARTWILCRPPGAPPGRPPGEGWQYRELATGHDAMITQPTELAELLLECT